MPICAVVNHKGGVGKTTISTNLAVGLNRAGNNVLLIDSDPQGSARDWRAAAEENSFDNQIMVAGLDRPTLDKDVPKIAQQFDWTIIDGAARDAVLTAQAIKTADIVLIPVRPSPYDCWAIADLVDIVKQRQAITDGKPKAAFVISSAIVGTKIGEEVRSVLADYELPTLIAGTYNRVIYANSAAKGMGVIDAEPDGQAANEIKKLVKEVIEL